MSINKNEHFYEKIRQILTVIDFYVICVSLLRERNNTWALERAKANVIRWYPVVGILDYMEESLNALAIEFPYFFNGAINIYNQFRKYICVNILIDLYFSICYNILSQLL